VLITRNDWAWVGGMTLSRLELLCVMAALLARKQAVSAAISYDAEGYLIYTTISVSGTPTGKQVLMFDAKISGDKWRIRTEPVIETNGGIEFFEMGITSDSMLELTVLARGYDPGDSPFPELRAYLKEAKKEEVFFTSADARLREAMVTSYYAEHFLHGHRSAARGRTTTASNINNVAVAVARRGGPPPADETFGAFLCFAFTPPSPRSDGTNQMLPQIWDDGNSRATRFRRAKWTTFDEPPRLISSAVYGWRGATVLPDGTLEDLRRPDATDLVTTAAVRYEVVSSTNFCGLRLPLDFRLSRFTTKDHVLVSTVVASTIKLTQIRSQDVSDIQLPPRTLVADYRSSPRGASGSAVTYLVISNVSASSLGLKHSIMCLGKRGNTQRSPRAQVIRWLLIAVLILPLAGMICFRKHLRFKKEPQMTSTGGDKH
jgi:hypothetical protein